MNQVSLIEYIGAGLFSLALLHSFSTKFFVRLAKRSSNHSGLLMMLGEVEVVFGFWAFVLLGFMSAVDGYQSAVEYLDTRNFTEPLFVFVILVIAGTRPVLQAAQLLIILPSSGGHPEKRRREHPWLRNRRSFAI